MPVVAPAEKLAEGSNDTAPPLPPLTQRRCGLILGISLICYGIFNTLLYIKFTPVYVATECGDQTARLEHLDFGDPIRVGLQISVTCFNPNGYQVSIQTSQPGRVWVGADRETMIGQLTLMEGSSLPDKGSGEIRVHMDADLSPATSLKLMPHFMADQEIPMFLELQFAVGVGLNFGFRSLGLTAPFKKKCGMNMAGVLVKTNTRLGPMKCRDTFEELDGHLPHVGEATIGSMSFSAAQMDPDRVAMGETAKNVSIIGIGSVCYAMGFWLVFQYVAFHYHQSGQYQPVSEAPLGKSLWFRSESRSVEQQAAGEARTGPVALLLNLSPFRKPAPEPAAPRRKSWSDWAGSWNSNDAESGANSSAAGGLAASGPSCLFGPVVRFMSCGASLCTKKGASSTVALSPASSSTAPRPVLPGRIDCNKPSSYS